MGDPYATDKPPSYEATDPYAQQQQQQQPMMLQPMGYSQQQYSNGQPMMMAQPYAGQPMMMAPQPYAMQPVVTQAYAQPYVVQPVVQVVVRPPEYNGFRRAIGVYEGTSLLCCCDDCGICCKTIFCPCCTYGHVAQSLANGDEQAGNAACVKCCIGSFLGCYICCAIQQRIQVKNMIYGRNESCSCGDFCSHCCCAPCALCQEDRIMNEVVKEKKERCMGAPGVQYMR